MDEVFSQTRDVSYAGVAAMSWMLWDTLIHLDVELEYIWRVPKAPWMKIAYAFIRYATILHMSALLMTDVGSSIRFPESACRIWIIEQGIFIELLVLIVEMILVLRVYVLFNHNKIVLWAMGILFVVEIAIMASAVGVSVPELAFDETCKVLGEPSYFTAYWVSSLAFETFLFALTLIAFVKRVKEVYKTQSVVLIYFVDGTWAFALIFVSMLLNTLMYKLNANPLAGIGYNWDLSVMSFAGAHLLLNLRRLQVGPQDAVTTQTAVSSMHFELAERSGATISASTRSYTAQTSTVNAV